MSSLGWANAEESFETEFEIALLHDPSSGSRADQPQPGLLTFCFRTVGLFAPIGKPAASAPTAAAAIIEAVFLEHRPWWRPKSRGEPCVEGWPNPSDVSQL